MMRSSCYGAFLLRGSQLSPANTLAYAELASIDLLPVSAIGLRMVAAANLVEVAARSRQGDAGRVRRARLADPEKMQAPILFGRRCSLVSRR
jgi:hypothetical protein